MKHELVCLRMIQTVYKIYFQVYASQIPKAMTQILAILLGTIKTFD